MMNKLAALLLAVSTLGCASENDGALHISGQLADASNVTHVVAANPTTGERVVVDLKADGQADGRFEIALPGGDGSWVVTFADASKTGAAMKIATLQTGGLDAFRTTDGGAIDFGTVKFNGKYAHGTTTWGRLSRFFGESESALRTRANLDDLSLRYSNPDVDGNGKLDALEGHEFRLDVDGTYRLQVKGADVTIGDLVTGLANPTVRYMGTTISAAVPADMGMNMLSGTVQFEQNFYGTVNSNMVPAGTRIGYPYIKYGELDGNQVVGVVAAGTSDAPSGAYKFGFDTGELTFSDVAAPRMGTMSSASDYAVPFVTIRTVKPGCKTDCDISSIDLEWMRATEHGWEQVKGPSDARLDVVAQIGSKRPALSTTLTDGATSQNWQDMPVLGSGITRNELSYINTNRLCYVAVSYASDLGMKMTSQTVNPGCY